MEGETKVLRNQNNDNYFTHPRPKRFPSERQVQEDLQGLGIRRQDHQLRRAPVQRLGGLRASDRPERNGHPRLSPGQNETGRIWIYQLRTREKDKQGIGGNWIYQKKQRLVENGFNVRLGGVVGGGDLPPIGVPIPNPPVQTTTIA